MKKIWWFDDCDVNMIDFILYVKKLNKVIYARILSTFQPVKGKK